MTTSGMTPPNAAALTPEKLLLTKRIIWFAILSTHVMFYVMGNVLILKGEGAGANSQATSADNSGLMHAFDNPSAVTLALVAILLLGASFLVPKILDGVFARASNDRSFAVRFRTDIIAFVIGCALNEAVAGLGLVGGFVILANPSFGSLLIFVSMIAMLARFPKKPVSSGGSLPTGVREG